jgi:glycerol-3-phosphate acyltransferase PlsY
MITWVVLGAYFIGSIPFALMLARRWGAADLRRTGSGNLGATNVLRTYGVTPGVMVALLDAGKGALSVWLADRVTGAGAASAAAVAAVVGHVYPVWFGFRGGKGVATACGAFSVLTPLAALIAFVIFLGGVWISRYVSFGSMLASAALPPAAYAAGHDSSAIAAACSAAFLIILRHRTNFVRLRAGTERRVGYRERRS